MRLFSFAVPGTMLVVSLCARLAHAQDNSAAVEALFRQGKELVASGRFAEACPKFLASYNLEHRVGTLLNLADCYEKNGQIASAWARFVEARALAARDNEVERVDFATSHAAALEPRRSTLTIVVPRPDPGLVVTRDGIVVDAAVLGVAVPLDGGTHTIEATAPGKVARTDSISIKPESDRQTYEVPPLADLRAKATVPPVEERSGVRPRIAVGLAIVGTGAVAVGIGAYFGATALSKNSESQKYCYAGTNNCWGQGVSLRDDAVNDATISTVLVATGAAAFVGGLVLLVTTPSSKNATAAWFDGQTLHVGGTF
jgi:hypothetical protein